MYFGSVSGSEDNDQGEISRYDIEDDSINQLVDTDRPVPYRPLLRRFGGENWVLPIGDYYEKTLNAFCFVDDENGIIVGANGIVLTSNDGGNTLIEQTSAITRKALRDVSFTDSNTGWIVGKEYESSMGSKGIMG